MSDLESKGTDELIELIEELREDIEEKEQAIEELQEETADLTIENEQHEDIDIESVAESAYNAGHSAAKKGDDCMRSWLNYKIEARI